MDVIPVNVTRFPNTLPRFNESSSREYIVYKLRIQHTFLKMKSLNCGGNLHLFCETGVVNYTVWNANITICNGMNIDIVSTIICWDVGKYYYLLFI